jgi:hypothetical protein
MLRLATDADVSGRLYRALLRQQPALDIVRAQDAGLRTAPDPDILAWAASENRALLTQDRDTMTFYAYGRIDAGLPMAGVFVLPEPVGNIGRIRDEVLIYVHCSDQHEWVDKVEFIRI